MSKKLKSISFVFENVDVTEIKRSDIQSIHFRGLRRNGVRWEHGRFTALAECKECIISLKSSANKKYKAFGVLSESKLFDRLSDCYNASSIVFVTLNFTDNTHFEVGMPWSGTENINLYQEVTTTSKGMNIYVKGKRGGHSVN